MRPFLPTTLLALLALVPVSAASGPTTSGAWKRDAGEPGGSGLAIRAAKILTFISPVLH